MAPGLPQSRDEADAFLFAAFRDGFRCALEENTGVGSESPLCGMLSHSRPMWLFSRFLCLDSTTDYHLLKALWDLAEKDGQGIAEFFRTKQSSEQYISLHSELKTEDQTPERVATLERRYFGDDVWRLAISRKLTLVSQWSSRYRKPQNEIRRNGSVFIADAKLWAWIDDCLKF